MILPTKHLLLCDSLLGVGAEVLQCLSRPCTVSELWTKCRNKNCIGTFNRFVMAIDVLYMIGAVDLVEGRIGRTSCFIR